MGDTPVLLARGHVAYHSDWAGQGHELEAKSSRPALSNTEMFFRTFALATLEI